MLLFATQAPHFAISLLKHTLLHICKYNLVFERSWLLEHYTLVAFQPSPRLDATANRGETEVLGSMRLRDWTMACSLECRNRHRSVSLCLDIFDFINNYWFYGELKELYFFSLYTHFPPYDLTCTRGKYARIFVCFCLQRWFLCHLSLVREDVLPFYFHSSKSAMERNPHDAVCARNLSHMKWSTQEHLV